MCALVIGQSCSTLRNGSNSNFGIVTIVARAHEAVHQDDHHPVDVKERQHAEQRRHLDAFDRVDLVQLRDDVAMREHHALGQTGRAR